MSDPSPHRQRDNLRGLVSPHQDDPWRPAMPPFQHQHHQQQHFSPQLGSYFGQQQPPIQLQREQQAAAVVPPAFRNTPRRLYEKLAAPLQQQQKPQQQPSLSPPANYANSEVETRRFAAARNERLSHREHLEHLIGRAEAVMQQPRSTDTSGVVVSPNDVSVSSTAVSRNTVASGGSTGNSNSSRSTNPQQRLHQFHPPSSSSNSRHVPVDLEATLPPPEYQPQRQQNDKGNSNRHKSASRRSSAATSITQQQQQQQHQRPVVAAAAPAISSTPAAAAAVPALSPTAINSPNLYSNRTITPPVSATAALSAMPRRDGFFLGAVDTMNPLGPREHERRTDIEQEESHAASTLFARILNGLRVLWEDERLRNAERKRLIIEATQRAVAERDRAEQQRRDAERKAEEKRAKAERRRQREVEQLRRQRLERELQQSRLQEQLRREQEAIELQRRQQQQQQQTTASRTKGNKSRSRSPSPVAPESSASYPPPANSSSQSQQQPNQNQRHHRNHQQQQHSNTASGPNAMTSCTSLADGGSFRASEPDPSRPQTNLASSSHEQQSSRQISEQNAKLKVKNNQKSNTNGNNARTLTNAEAGSNCSSSVSDGSSFFTSSDSDDDDDQLDPAVRQLQREVAAERRQATDLANQTTLLERWLSLPSSARQLREGVPLEASLTELGEEEMRAKIASTEHAVWTRLHGAIFGALRDAWHREERQHTTFERQLEEEAERVKARLALHEALRMQQVEESRQQIVELRHRVEASTSPSHHRPHHLNESASTTPRNNNGGAAGEEFPSARRYPNHPHLAKHYQQRFLAPPTPGSGQRSPQPQQQQQQLFAYPGVAVPKAPVDE